MLDKIDTKSEGFIGYVLACKVDVSQTRLLVHISLYGEREVMTKQLLLFFILHDVKGILYSHHPLHHQSLVILDDFCPRKLITD